MEQFVRHIIGLVIAVLFSALSAVAMPTMPTTAHQAEFFSHQHAFIAEHGSVHFAARAPPPAATNVAFTGAAVAEHGNGIVVYGYETHVASLGFGVVLDATNRAATYRVEWHVPDQAAATRVQNAFATASYAYHTNFITIEAILI